MCCGDLYFQILQNGHRTEAGRAFAYGYNIRRTFRHCHSENEPVGNEFAELLNAYCGYAIAEDEILLLDVNGTMYFISDIGLRMLTPRELYAANGFPPDYIIDHDYTGKAYGKTKQVARCGNAVPPPFAEALVRANLPEMCGRQLETMKELYGVI